MYAQVCTYSITVVSVQYYAGGETTGREHILIGREHILIGREHVYVQYYAGGETTRFQQVEKQTYNASLRGDAAMRASLVTVCLSAPPPFLPKRNDELWVIARPRLCARGVRAGLAAGPVCSDARSPCDAGRFRWEIWGGVEDFGFKRSHGVTRLMSRSRLDPPPPLFLVGRRVAPPLLAKGVEGGSASGSKCDMRCGRACTRP